MDDRANIAAQLREELSSLRLAAAQLAPASARERDPDLDERAARLDRSFYRLLRIAEELSAAAALAQEQEEPLPLRDQDLVELVGSVCDRAAEPAELLGLKLRFTCPQERIVCAVCPDALEKLLYHLLSNAFRATPAGGSVTVDLRRRDGMVCLCVEDTGQGISPERLPSLFQGPTEDLHPRGLGLGLPLCVRIARGHGGRLVAESQEGRGSRFTLSLPDRRGGNGVQDVPLRYSAGFDRTLLALADVLPARAFLIREQD